VPTFSRMSADKYAEAAAQAAAAGRGPGRISPDLMDQQPLVRQRQRTAEQQLEQGPALPAQPVYGAAGRSGQAARVEMGAAPGSGHHSLFADTSRLAHEEAQYVGESADSCRFCCSAQHVSSPLLREQRTWWMCHSQYNRDLAEQAPANCCSRWRRIYAKYLPVYICLTCMGMRNTACARYRGRPPPRQQLAGPTLQASRTPQSIRAAGSSADSTAPRPSRTLHCAQGRARGFSSWRQHAAAGSGPWGVLW
jgi:hypothetical protein